MVLPVVVGAVALGLNVVGVPIFLMFILEEAVQAAGFGVYSLLRVKEWNAAKKQVAFYRSLALKLKDMATALGSFGGVPAPVGVRQAEFSDVQTLRERLLKNFHVEGVKVEDQKQKADSLQGFLSVFTEPFLLFAEASLKTADAYDKAIKKGMLEEL